MKTQKTSTQKSLLPECVYKGARSSSIFAINLGLIFAFVQNMNENKLSKAMLLKTSTYSSVVQFIGLDELTEVNFILKQWTTFRSIAPNLFKHPSSSYNSRACISIRLTEFKNVLCMSPTCTFILNCVYVLRRIIQCSSNLKKCSVTFFFFWYLDEALSLFQKSCIQGS